MKQPVTLKGRKEGYELIVNEDSPLADVKVALKELLDNLAKDLEKAANKENVELEIYTQRRLFRENEKNELAELLTDYEQLSLKSVYADVVTREEATKWKEADNVQICTTRVRSGQVLVYPGDVLVLSTVQPGGTVKAVGNIYVLGDVQGMLHAGIENNEEAFIVGNLSNAGQLRVAEIIDIVQKDDDNENKEKPTIEKQVAYINDLHVMEYTTLEAFSQLKPKLLKEIGGI